MIVEPGVISMYQLGGGYHINIGGGGSDKLARHHIYWQSINSANMPRLIEPIGQRRAKLGLPRF